MATRDLPVTETAYRPDIDGLRALAVLAVVGFHAFPGRLPGGFIGVDVFFVISGYLITSIIASHLQRGDFSFLAFYQRRVRRIFPALLVVLTAALVLAWPLMLRDEFRTLGKHVVGGAAFVSNFVLREESNYFAEASEFKPLLHLWSLAVEEQFYLVWPLILWLLRRRPLFMWLGVAGVGVASFAANVHLSGADAATAFYGPASRFWELMAGAALVPLASRCPTKSNGAAIAMSSAGAALLAAGLFLIDSHSGFPGWWALLPVSGTCMLVAAGPEAPLNSKLLSQRHVVAVGLISYPLYLWHWVLISFAFIYINHYPPTGLKLGAVALSFVLAWATWRFVEKPVRFGAGAARWASRLVLAMAMVAALGVAIMSGWVRNASMFREIDLTQAQVDDEIKRFWEGDSFHFDERPVRVVVFGDSQARDLFRAFRYDGNLGLSSFSSPAVCHSFSASEEDTPSSRKSCADRFEALVRSTQLRQADFLVYSRLDGQVAGDAQVFKKNVATLRKVNPSLQIQVWGAKPYLGDKGMSIRRLMRDYPGQPGINEYLAQGARRMAPTAAELATLREAGVRWIDVQSIACNPGCVFYADGQYAYFDITHWTEFGVRTFARRLEASGLDPFPARR